MLAGVDEASRFVVGDWVVDVAAHQLKLSNDCVTLEPRQMAVLATLCRRAGQIISADDLLQACWNGEATGDNPLHKVVTALRRSLRDDATAPRYIETIRKQGYRLIAPVKALSHEGERSLRGGWRGKSPFRGLQAFDASHASVFFGREDEIAELRQRLGEQWQRGETLAVLLGPSGSGKTSLVQAGLLPAMLARRSVGERFGENVNENVSENVSDSAIERFVGRAIHTPAAPLQACAAACVDLGANEILGPWSALAGGLLDWEIDAQPLLSGYSIDALSATLQARPDEVLRALRVALTALGVPVERTPPILVLDRFEALLHADAAANRPGVMACLAQLAQSRLLLTLVVSRNDFYPEIARLPLLMQGKPQGAHMDLAPPSARAIAQMIRLPARAAGLSFGADPAGLNRLDDRLCADAARAQDALPLLQYTLQALYQARAAGDELSWQAYEALGGLEGAIGRRAETVLAGLPMAQQEALPALLSRLVGLAEQAVDDTQATARWATLADIRSPDEQALVQALVEARLLVSDHLGGIAGIRVAHEALLRCWPRVTGWIAQHRAMLALRDELSPWVRRWREGGRAASLLLPRGALLWRAAGALSEAPALFADADRDCVSRSLTRLRRQTQWRWAASIATGVLALAAVAVAARNAQLVRVATEREQQSQRLSSFMLGDLADQLRPIGKLDLLESVGQQGVTLLGKATEGPESPEDALQRAKALTVIGEVNSSRGKNKIALALNALHQADTLLEALGQPSTALPLPSLDKARGTTAFWLGQIAFDAGDFDEASRQMNRYRAVSEHWLAAMPGDPQATSELAYAVGSLGAIAMRRGAWAEATRWYEDSLRMKLDALVQSPDDPERIEAVATTRTWLGQLAYVRGELEDALTSYNLAHEAHSELQRRYAEQKSRIHDLAIIHMRRAEAMQAMGRNVDALSEMKLATNRYRAAVANDTHNRRWLLEALHAESGTVLFGVYIGMTTEAEVLALRKRLIQEVSAPLRQDVIWQEAELQTWAAEGEVAARSNDWWRVKAIFQQSLPALRELLARRPHDGFMRELEATFLLLSMEALTHIDTQQALTDECKRNVEILHPLVRAGYGGLVFEAWLLARQCAGYGEANGAYRARLTDGGYSPQYCFSIFKPNRIHVKKSSDRTKRRPRSCS